MRAQRPGEDDLKAICAVGEIFKRLNIRIPGVGVIQPGKNTPGACVGAQGARAALALIDRRERDCVRGFGDELVERAAFQCGFRRLAPIGFG